MEEAKRPEDANLSGFDELRPGQRETIALPHRLKESVVKSPRFWATVLDVSGGAADAAVQSCCVFLVPQVHLHFGRGTQFIQHGSAYIIYQLLPCAKVGADPAPSSSLP